MVGGIVFYKHIFQFIVKGDGRTWICTCSKFGGKVQDRIRSDIRIFTANKVLPHLFHKTKYSYDIESIYSML